MIPTREEFAELVKEYYRKSHTKCMTEEEIDEIFVHPDAIDMINGGYDHWLYMYNNGELSERQFRSYSTNTTEYNIELYFG